MEFESVGFKYSNSHEDRMINYLVSCFYSKHTQVLAGNGETEQALVYIKKADQLDPNNKVSLT